MALAAPLKPVPAGAPFAAPFAPSSRRRGGVGSRAAAAALGGEAAGLAIGAMGVEWGHLSSEHLAVLGAFAEHPADLCRAEVVCRAWRGGLREPRGQESLWRALCAAWYPTMAARVLSEGGDSGDTDSCRPSPSLGPASPALNATSPFGTPAGGPAPMPPLGCEWRLYEETPGSGSASSGDGASADAAAPPAAIVGDVAASALLGFDAVDADPARWRVLFQRRFQRQLEWDRRRQKRCGADRKAATEEPEEPKPKSDGKFHPSGRAKVTRGRENGREKFHAQRLRTCKRCGCEFNPQQREPQACSWHVGRYMPIGEDGVLSSALGAAGRNFERRAQSIIKAHNRTKGSKRANMIVFDLPCETGVARPDGAVWRWSCCHSESLVATGCSTGQHS